MVNPFINFELIRLHKLIKSKSTGTPKQLAKKLNCSERTARQKIETLRQAGLPVAYCKTKTSYYYIEEVNLNVDISLGKEEMDKIVGGQGNQYIFLKNIHTADFLPCDNGTLTLYSAGIPLQDRNIYLPE